MCCALPTQCLYTRAISKPITRARSWQWKTITNNNQKSSTYTHRHHMYLWLFSNQFVCIVWFYSAYVYMCTYFDAQLCNLIRVLTFTSLQSSSSGSLSLYVTWVKGRDTKRAREHNECVCVCVCLHIYPTKRRTHKQVYAHLYFCMSVRVCITFVLTLIPFSCSRSTHALSTASQTRTFSIFSGILKYLNVLAVNNLLYIIFYILYLYVHMYIL